MDGIMHEAGYFEMNLVTWYELKQFGIAIIGPNAQDLDFTVHWEHLITKMHENLNSYWKKWLSKSTFYIRGTDIEWGVLGVTRLFYTFREHGITTKAQAGDYALQVVPKQFHKILEESIHIRRQKKGSLYRSIIKRKHDANQYMKYIMDECDKMAKS
ncbi:hypothetical protein D3C78_1502730 [compost metagenome]